MKKIDITEYIQKSGAELSLSPNERERMAGVVSEYMKMKPIRNGNTVKPKSVGTWSWLYVISRRYVAVFVIGAILLSGAGVSYAAEGTLPGDVLYPVKVSVNEKVVSALSVSQESKASWNATRAGRRLAEAVELASKGKLTPAVSAQLTEKFDEQADSAESATAEVEHSDPGKAIALASKFETNLSAHEELLDDAGTEDAHKLAAHARIRVGAIVMSRLGREHDAGVGADETAGVSVAALSARAMPQAASLKTAVSVKVATTTHRGQEAALRMGTAAKKSFTLAQASFSASSAGLSDSVRTSAQEKITEADVLIQKGDTLSAQSEFTQAFRAYQEAVTSLGRISVFLSASKNIGTTTASAPILRLRIQKEGSEKTDGEIKLPVIRARILETLHQNGESESADAPDDK